MIITKLQGGIGNQMFQYALGRVLAIKNNKKLKYDARELNKIGPTGAYRALEIGVFNIQAVEAEEKEVEVFRPTFWYRVIPFLNKLNKNRYYVQKGRDFDEQVFNLKDNCYLDGYWQSWRYFKDYSDIVRQDFTLKNDYLEKVDKKLFNQIKGSNSIGIHIRRGDYISNELVNKIHGVCGKEYYDRAIKLIQEKIKDPVFYIFSDDPEWCKKEFGSDFKIIAGNPGWLDLWLMSKCRHQIIANSSFSWWAAWLNENKDKTVIMPKNWFAGVSTKIKNRVLDNWILI